MTLHIIDLEDGPGGHTTQIMLLYFREDRTKIRGEKNISLQGSTK